ncbi:hypothetical protein OG250_17580 [Streptomyces sp. NBC_00487]|uniref:hypothetical protein n=1 Tax=unclassified Streptomyces TaxID=2593676 RepID=UPI002DDB3D5E|nr:MULTISPECIES: hypothetical protein [unclassified Streptomyces]WRY96520.1 hypothetical protein OG889_18285 [Streptomyces sp. NBC_00481]
MRTLATATRAGVLAATAGALLFTGVAAQGTAVAAPQGKPAKLTVAKYRDWLKNNDEATASLKLLKAFDKLPKAKQQKFVDYLQNRKVQEAYNVRAGGYINRGGHNEEAYNKDVRFVADIKGVRKATRAGSHITLTFTATERIYNLPVITQKTVLSYDYGSAVKSPKYKRSVTNLNGAVAITPVKKDAIKVSGRNISATTTWKAAPLYRSVGATPLTKRQTTATVNVKFNAWVGNR